MLQKNLIKAVILDLDQTITIDQGSWLQFTKLIGADYKIHETIYNQFRSGDISYPEAKSKLINLWKKSNNLEKNDIKNVFEKIELRDGSREAINYLKGKYKLCIISGAIDTFVEVFAERLEISNWYASTKFIFNEKNVLQDFDYKLSRGEDKVGFLNDFCIHQSFHPYECAAIGDGESDMPIFDKVGMPILFIAKETTEDQINKIENHIKNWSEINKFL